MLDLCYNCANCHAQFGPCPRDLVLCEICYSWGHQYIFCPRGVTRRDPGYRYWALCHNCDLWHLPNPCEKDHHQCKQCGHTGHMEIFCPVNPTDRTSYADEQYRRLVEGSQQPTNHDMRPPFSGALPQDFISRIKLDAVRQAFNMLEQHWSPNQVIMFMGGPPPPPGRMPMGRGSSGALFQLPGSVHQGIAQHVPRAQLPSNATPTQSTGIQTSPLESNDAKHGSEVGTYDKMHQRFEQGDLARSIQQERPMDTVPMTSNLPMTQGMLHLSQAMPTVQVTTPMTPTTQDVSTNVQTGGMETQSALAGLLDDSSEQQATATIETAEGGRPVKKTKQKKTIKTEREDTPTVKQGPRCAACIKSHKKCKHRVLDSPTPQAPPNSSFDTPSAPADYVPTSGGAPEGYVQAPPTMPDHSFTLPAEATSMPTPVEPKKAATTKRKR